MIVLISMACVQADEEVDSLMEELEEMDAYNDRPPTGTSTAEDSAAQVDMLSLNGPDQCEGSEMTVVRSGCLIDFPPPRRKTSELFN